MKTLHWTVPVILSIIIILYTASQMNDPAAWDRLSTQAMISGDFAGALAAKMAQNESGYGSAFWFTIKSDWVVLLIGGGTSFALFKNNVKKI